MLQIIILHTRNFFGCYETIQKLYDTSYRIATIDEIGTPTPPKSWGRPSGYDRIKRWNAWMTN